MRIKNVLLLLLVSAATMAQTSDQLIRQVLEKRGIRFSSNNNVRLLTSGQNKFDCMFEEIRNARESIHLEYFNFRNDSIASLLFDILAQKAKEGVEIRALYDAFGNSSNNQPLRDFHIDNLRRRGIEIYEFDPIRFPWVNHVFSRDHRKIVIIDGKVAFTGGMNVADYYIHGTPQVGSWRDMHCRITGEEVNTLQTIFLTIWHKTTHQYISGDKYFRGSEPGSEQGNITVGIINREPRVSPKIIREFYVNAIDVAKDSIKLINPYFTLSPRLMKALKGAARRGVKVEIMLSEKSDIPLTPDCGFYNAHKLMKAGCHVWIYRPGFHHTKVIMVDGRFCTVGSANLNARSLRWDYEENAVILNHQITQQLCDLFDRDKKDSFYLTPDSWDSFRTTWQKFRGWFAHLLAPFL